MEDLLKIGVPIFTFVLGSMLTIAIKIVEQHRDVLRSAARESAKLTKEWYVQIHTLALPRLDSMVSPSIHDYVNNRLILPDFVMNLEVLRTNRRASALVSALQDFLNAVTQVRPRPVAGRSVLLLECLEPNLHPRQEVSGENAGLRELDVHVQRVAREAAKLLV
jgi:hypothetical protein